MIVRSNSRKKFYGSSVKGDPLRVHSLVVESVLAKDRARVRFPLNASPYYCLDQ